MPGRMNVLALASVDELKDLYLVQHLTYSQIGRVLGCSTGSVYKVIHANGINPRSRGYEKGKRHLSEEDRERISRIHKGKVVSQETRLKQRLSWFERYEKGQAVLPRWNNGRREKRRDGYVQVKAKGHPYASKEGYVFEHRLVMEKLLGRYLEPEEVVHHINGIRNDNRPENLFLFSSISEHTKYHMKKRKDAKTL